jgi:hypothetical protein
MTGETIQIMQANRALEMRYAEAFQRLFGCRLHDYFNYVTGFDIVKFDKDIATPDGTSTSMWIQQKYGTETISLIRKLIGCSVR